MTDLQTLAAHLWAQGRPSAATFEGLVADALEPHKRDVLESIYELELGEGESATQAAWVEELILLEAGAVDALDPDDYDGPIGAWVERNWEALTREIIVDWQQDLQDSYYEAGNR